MSKLNYLKYYVSGVGSGSAVPAIRAAVLGEGQMGSALMGSLQMSCLLTEGFVGYSR